MKLTLENNGEKTEVDPFTEEGGRLVSRLYAQVSAYERVHYEPTWMGIPIIQYANDMVMMQELIWKVRPELIIETGIAHGGSALYHSSLLELIGRGEILCIDIDIRKYNRAAIQSHSMSKRITMLEGSSIDDGVVAEATMRAKDCNSVMVVLDSNHTYAHVLAEMERYGDLVGPGGYMVVMDGLMRDLSDTPAGKPEWITDNPVNAIEDFLAEHDEWEIDEHYTRLKVTSNPKGFLRRKQDLKRS